MSQILSTNMVNLTDLLFIFDVFYINTKWIEWRRSLDRCKQSLNYLEEVALNFELIILVLVKSWPRLLIELT